jgi:polar amino acid transport system substrate-binding protein
MPFFGNEGKADEGFILKITRMIFNDAGIEYRFEKVPVNRIFEALKESGPYCFPGVFKKADRLRLYIFSNYPVYQDGPLHYIIRKKDRSRFDNVHTIENLLRSNAVLGKIESYSHGEWADSNIAKFSPKKFVINIGDNQNTFFEMLLQGRFDYIFAGEEEAVYNLSANEQYRENLMISDLRDAPAGNIRWIIFSKGFPKDKLARINASILRVKKSAKYQSIVDDSKKEIKFNIRKFE